jgi:Tautomerase enzyme
VHEGLVETCSVPPNDRFQLVSTYSPEMMFIDPTFPDVARAPDASIIEILFLEGRTVEQKQNLFRRIADRAVRAGFSGDDVMIALSENAPVDWSLGPSIRQPPRADDVQPYVHSLTASARTAPQASSASLRLSSRRGLARRDLELARDIAALLGEAAEAV